MEKMKDPKVEHIETADRSTAEASDSIEWNKEMTRLVLFKLDIR
jgi:hypothetical protein